VGAASRIIYALGIPDVALLGALAHVRDDLARRRAHRPPGGTRTASRSGRQREAVSAGCRTRPGRPPAGSAAAAWSCAYGRAAAPAPALRGARLGVRHRRAHRERRRGGGSGRCARGPISRAPWSCRRRPRDSRRRYPGAGRGRARRRRPRVRERDGGAGAHPEAPYRGGDQRRAIACETVSTCGGCGARPRQRNGVVSRCGVRALLCGDAADRRSRPTCRAARSRRLRVRARGGGGCSSAASSRGQAWLPSRFPGLRFSVSRRLGPVRVLMRGAPTHPGNSSRPRFQLLLNGRRASRRWQLRVGEARGCAATSWRRVSTPAASRAPGRRLALAGGIAGARRRWISRPTTRALPAGQAEPRS